MPLILGTHYKTAKNMQEETKNESQFLNKKELGSLLKVSDRTTDNIVANKVLPVYKIGRLVRFKKSDVTDYIARSLQS